MDVCIYIYIYINTCHHWSVIFVYVLGAKIRGVVGCWESQLQCPVFLQALYLYTFFSSNVVEFIIDQHWSTLINNINLCFSQSLHWQVSSCGWSAGPAVPVQGVRRVQFEKKTLASWIGPVRTHVPSGRDYVCHSNRTFWVDVQTDYIHTI